MMQEVFVKAAKSALTAWKQDHSGVDDLVNDLWAWYLERPGTQRKMDVLAFYEAVETARRAALQMLSKQQLSSNEFNGRNLYSSDAVKDALKGESTNRYLLDILPLAIESLGNQNEDYAEEIRKRYDDGIVPPQGKHVKLVRAVKSLTEHVNIIAITAGVDSDGNVSEGPGSRHAVFPEIRKPLGDTSDPTGNIAVMLIENPDVRDEYLAETPLPEFLGGRGYAQSA